MEAVPILSFFCSSANANPPNVLVLFSARDHSSSHNSLNEAALPRPLSLYDEVLWGRTPVSMLPWNPGVQHTTELSLFKGKRCGLCLGPLGDWAGGRGAAGAAAEANTISLTTLELHYQMLPL